MAKKAQVTPMMAQYLAVKKQYPDAFLFYRLGDFYEMFYDDAIKGAQLLELTLTTRNKNAKDPIPMCGVPHHAAQNYIDILVDQGYKVAICEQMEDPKLAKGMVKREVIQLVTPGTHMEAGAKVAKELNFLAAVHFQEEKIGLAYVELSTGELKVTTLTDAASAINELINLNVKEVVLDDSAPEAFCSQLAQLKIMQSPQNQLLTKAEFSYAMQPLAKGLQRQTVQRLLSYLAVTQKRSLSHLQQVQAYRVAQYLKLSPTARINLDLVQNARTKKKAGTLLWLLDRTQTAMGGRKLKEIITHPLIDEENIKQRQAQVQVLLDHYFERSNLKEELKHVYDLERLVGKVAFKTVNPRDMIQLQTSLQHVPAISYTVREFAAPEFKELVAALDPLTDVAEAIEKTIVPEPPLTLSNGGFIRSGCDEQLDKYNDAMKNGKQWLAQLEEQERKQTGIHNLKIGYNRVFGYYIEVSKANLEKLPEDRYQRKQTLTNSERFITPELKEKERLILEAQSQAVVLEHELFDRLRDQIKEQTPRLQRLAQALAMLDVLLSFAQVSEDGNFVKPELSAKSTAIEIEAGWHPVVAQVMKTDEYIPNSVTMKDDCDVLLITGPNMSGKSTYMRQLALTVILAQIGCFVPAKAAKLPLFDQIFTRIGAADDLISGESTFMVEMKEANAALQHATRHSLLLFDELGRGTATYDGLALAQAIIEFVHNHLHAKTLFATHYHELTVLDRSLPKLTNVHVGAVEKNGELIFLHQVKPGAADRSYGIHVAKLAGLPQSLIERADTILGQLEQNSSSQLTAKIDHAASATASSAGHPTPAAPVEASSTGSSTAGEHEQQLALFALPTAKPAAKDHVTSKERSILKKLAQMNLMNKTPMEVLNQVYEWQQQLQKSK